MVRAPRPSPASADPARMAMEAVQAGDLRMALEYFAKAVNADKRNASHRYNFALCAEQLGQIEHAAREYSNALHLNRIHTEAPRRLAGLLRNYTLQNWGVLDQLGLMAAFRAPQVDTQPLANAALHWLKSQTQLGAVLKEADEQGHEAVARRLLLDKPDAILGHELLTAALALGVNTHTDLEPLLTALRRILALEAGPALLADKTAHTLALCLAEHGRASSYIWITTPQEDAFAAALVDLAAVKAGDIDAAHALLLRALYRPLTDICGEQLAVKDCGSVKPRAFRDLLLQHLGQAEDEQRLAATLPRLGTISDATSQRVAAHYDANLQPRWTTLQRNAPGALRRALQRFFSDERLAFLDQPFDVLEAGCGTGQKAIDLAVNLGANARVLGLDLSRKSLAYGRRMTQVHNVKNIELAEGDILDLAASGRRFDIIMCAGVLHHMADPFAGWQALNACLKPGGLQLIGLSSETARRELEQLRAAPGYPGVDCTSAQARAWRQSLMTRKPDEPGGRLVKSQDFYSLPEFRDLLLHSSEHHLTLPRIETFLKENGLTFRGFLVPMPTLAAFAEAYPDEKWPGTLAQWHAFEQKNPTVFEGMYQFWCEKAV